MKLVVYLIPVLCVYPLYSQSCTNRLWGEVKDFHDGSSLAGATLVLSPSGQIVKTGANGTFSISGLCEGFYEVEVSHPACRTQFFEVRVSGDTYQKITLEHHLEELGEVVVAENRFRRKTKSASEQTLGEAVLERFSAATLGDALREVSGVSSLNTGNAIAKPVIHGLHSSRVLLIQNNVRMFDQEWGVEHAPNIDLNTVGNITVVKGASALRYGGDAIGGVIVAEAEKPPVRDSLYGKTFLTTATNGRGGSLSSEIIKGYANGWNWKAQATLKRFGDMETPDYILSNTGVFNRNVALSLGLNTFTQGFSAYYSRYQTTAGILRASHIGNIEDLVRAINSGIPLRIDPFTYSIQAPKQEITHQLAKIQYFKRFEEIGKINLQYAYQENHRLEFDIRRGADKEKPALDLKLSTHTLDALFEADAAAAYKLTGGITTGYQTNFPNPNTGVRRLIPDYTKIDAGVFITVSHNLSSAIEADAGVRYDYSYLNAKKFYLKSRWEERNYQADFSHLIIGDYGSEWLTRPIFRFHNLAAMAGITYSIAPWANVRFNYGLANRNPNPAELFSDGLHHSAASIEVGDLRFKKERAHQVSITFEGSTHNFSFQIAPYLNAIHNFILLQPTGLQYTIRGAFPVLEYVQTNACLLGLDIDASLPLDKLLTLSTRFSYLHGNDVSNHIPLTDMPPMNCTTTLSFTKPEFYNFNVSLESETVFRQNRYPDNNFNITTLYEGNPVTTLVAISNPPKGYQLFHLRSSLQFQLSEKLRMNVSGELENLLNVNYRNYLNRLRYYADEAGRNFLFTLKLNY